MNDHELELIKKREFARGYESGEHVMDADRYAVKLRLQRLDFEGGSHENLAKIAYAVYPCATGWTCDSAAGLRDELIRLMGGGVGDNASNSMPFTTTVTTTDTTRDGDLRLEVERIEAVANLRKYDVNNDTYDAFARAIGVSQDECIRTRLIYLLGGDEPTESLGSYLSRKSVEAMSRRADHVTDDGTTPNDDGTCPNAVQGASITSELRKYAKTQAYPHNDRLRAIADRIDTEHQLVKVIADASQSDEYIAMDEYRMVAEERDELNAYANDQHEKLREAESKISQLERRWHMEQQSCNSMIAERDELQAKLDEYDDTHIELPRGKDGRHIRVGDTVQYEDGEPFEVTRIVLYNDDTAWVSDGDEYGDMLAEQLHHYHTDVDGDTAETIVRELTLGKITECEAVERIEALHG